jgi:hypothetical protein
VVCLQIVRGIAGMGRSASREMSANLRPLEETAVERLKTWLPKLSHPVRIGEHDQTAFGLGLMLDYARSAENEGIRQTG